MASATARFGYPDIIRLTTLSRMEADGFIVENFSELKELFRKHEKQMQQACDKALARGAMNIVAEAKRNLRLTETT